MPVQGEYEVAMHKAVHHLTVSLLHRFGALAFLDDELYATARSETNGHVIFLAIKKETLFSSVFLDTSNKASYTPSAIPVISRLIIIYVSSSSNMSNSI
jgi:hypothetical protein